MARSSFLYKSHFDLNIADSPMGLFFNSYVFDGGIEPFLPSGGSSKRLVIKDTFDTDYRPDVEALVKVKVTFVGDFEHGPDGWSGTIKKVTFSQDGEVAGSIGRFGGGLDIADLTEFGSAGAVWETLAQDGFRGRLSDEGNKAGLSLGDDRVKGGAGMDFISAGFGDDRVWGGGGHDYLDGADGRDTLIGGAGNDTLLGGSASDLDILKGGSGDDVFSGNSGLWTGGSGADTFKFTSLYFDSTSGVTIRDFDRGDGDTLLIDPFLVFDMPAEAKYLKNKVFTGDASRLEFRMEDGKVEIDVDGDKAADFSIYLQGHDTFGAGDMSWISLPFGTDFI